MENLHFMCMGVWPPHKYSIWIRKNLLEGKNFFVIDDFAYFAGLFTGQKFQAFYRTCHPLQKWKSVGFLSLLAFWAISRTFRNSGWFGPCNLDVNSWWKPSTKLWGSGIFLPKSSKDKLEKHFRWISVYTVDEFVFDKQDNPSIFIFFKFLSQVFLTTIKIFCLSWFCAHVKKKKKRQVFTLLVTFLTTGFGRLSITWPLLYPTWHKEKYNKIWCRRILKFKLFWRYNYNK